MRQTRALQGHIYIGEVFRGSCLPVLSARRDFGIDGAVHQAVGFQLAKLQSQGALRDFRQFLAKLAEPADARNAQMPKDEDLPLSAEHVHGLLNQPCIGICDFAFRLHSINHDSRYRKCVYLH